MWQVGARNTSPSPSIREDLTSLCTPCRGRAAPQPLPEAGAASCCQRRSCCGSGHWVCCFCPSHARLRCTSEKAWIKIQGNAVRRLSNTGGRNKTRMKCNGILNRKSSEVHYFAPPNSVHLLRACILLK